MDKIYLVEVAGCDYHSFETFSDAMMFALEYIEKSSCNDDTKKEMYKELLTSMSERDIDKWGWGYSVDEFVWCWEIPFKPKSKT